MSATRYDQFHVEPFYVNIAAPGIQEFHVKQAKSAACKFHVKLSKTAPKYGWPVFEPSSASVG
ncbi:MAG: hypothetical protein MK179_05265 [Pirellulaceae bacterium]|nr:hypothetical protein [Pirellulaceae bacterium]